MVSYLRRLTLENFIPSTGIKYGNKSRSYGIVLESLLYNGNLFKINFSENISIMIQTILERKREKE
jgi:hypothetical protein